MAGPLLQQVGFCLATFSRVASLLTAEPGTVAFNEQLGKMTALSFPVIALPAMTVMMGNIFYLFRGIKSLTGLDLESIVKQK